MRYVGDGVILNRLVVSYNHAVCTRTSHAHAVVYQGAFTASLEPLASLIKALLGLLLILLKLDLEQRRISITLLFNFHK